MGRRARNKRLARKTDRPEPEAQEPHRQGRDGEWMVAVFLMWMFTLISVPAGLGLLAAIEPILVPLLYRPAEGVVVSFRGGDEPGDGLYPVVRFEVDGMAYTCSSWVCVVSGRSAVRPGKRLRVYHPAGRPAEGFVCDWSENRARTLLSGLGFGLAVAGVTLGFVRFVPGSPLLGSRPFARWAAKALAVWVACVLLGAASGLVLLGPGNLLAMLAGPAAGGALGCFLALRDARRWGSRRDGQDAGTGTAAQEKSDPPDRHGT